MTAPDAATAHRIRGFWVGPVPPGGIPEPPMPRRPVPQWTFPVPPPGRLEDYDWDNIEVEDGEPVESWYADCQMRLMVEPLYSSWPGPADGRGFWACDDVGLFFAPGEPPVIPDAMLTLGLRPPKDDGHKSSKTFVVARLGRVPDFVFELVSDKRGEEDGSKLRLYAEIGVRYYAVYDPLGCLGTRRLRLYRLPRGRKRYGRPLSLDRLTPGAFLPLPELELGLTLWAGRYESLTDEWTRWTDADGRLIATGQELAASSRAAVEAERAKADAAQSRADAERAKADAAQSRTDAERAKADAERAKADAERARADALAAELRKLGIDPDSLARRKARP